VTLPNALPLPIATRTSPLALAQALMVQSLLAGAHAIAEGEAAFPIVGMTTTGDRITDRALLEAGGKGLFTKELEYALMDGTARMAVHSMKDVPTRLPDGLKIACVLEREDPSDLLLTAHGPARLSDLPEGATLGTASIRRQAQALHLRPDLKIALIRGNVDTRLGKLRAGEVDATFLARAGLRRLERPEGEWAGLDPAVMLPAVAQGAIGIEVREDDEAAIAALAPLDHAPTRIAIAAERGVLAALDGSCRTPIAAYATLNGATLALKAEALSPDGRERWTAEDTFELPETDERVAWNAGRELGGKIRQSGGARLEAILDAHQGGGF
jgi:hydroxymethylbilane synthase